jgi:hypothetical protein
MHDFIDVYHATMERVAASDFYRFPESYFHESREALGNTLIYAASARIGQREGYFFPAYR